ncbi:unnamed protein product [Rotaria socialis]|uniref:Uncharacterized protein n=1 Tax=Rotaria socialis TaxID=392032 RepID=A0A821F1Q3_9BILA|nr:unnamed protein product [Rotaria socialis]CAF4644199.1 unnamed protein product [Rotaria socialis]
MFKSKFTCVSNPSSKSDDDENEQQRNNDDAEKSEVRLNTTSNSSPTQTTSPVPSHTGGLYIPPATLRLLDTSSVDKSSVEYQRTQWDALERNINLLVDQANESNICPIINELFNESIRISRIEDKRGGWSLI